MNVSLWQGCNSVSAPLEGENWIQHLRAQELCESRGGRPGLPVPNTPYGLCGRKATLNERKNNNYIVRAQELCESPGPSMSLIVRTVSVDVKQH